jgi:hypothetical protein
MIALHNQTNPPLSAQKIIEAFEIANIPYKKIPIPQGTSPDIQFFIFVSSSFWRTTSNPMELILVAGIVGTNAEWQPIYEVTEETDEQGHLQGHDRIRKRATTCCCAHPTP